jgi:hypothetical protein
MGDEVSDGLHPFFEIPPHLFILWTKRKKILSKSQLEKPLAQGGRFLISETTAASNVVMLRNLGDLSLSLRCSMK